LLRFVAPLRCCIALHRAPCAAFRVSTNDISEAGYTELKDGTLTSLLRQLLDEWFGISICADDLTSVRNTASCIARVSLGGILHQEAESRSGPVNQPAAVLECRTQIEASGSQLIQVIPGLIGDQNHASGGFIGTECAEEKKEREKRAESSTTRTEPGNRIRHPLPWAERAGPGIPADHAVAHPPALARAPDALPLRRPHQLASPQCTPSNSSPQLSSLPPPVGFAGREKKSSPVLPDRRARFSLSSPHLHHLPRLFLCACFGHWLRVSVVFAGA